MSKKITIFILALGCSITSFSQQIITQVNPTYKSEKQTLVMQPTNFFVSTPVRDLPATDDFSVFTGKFVPRDGVNTGHEMSEKRKRKLAYLLSAGKSNISMDPLAATGFNQKHQTATRAPIENFEGIGIDVSPPDPSMAVGPNHVVTMENGLWAVYDKSGNIAAGFPRSLTNPLQAPGSTNIAGDPIVMYDREADRWFISQFQLPNSDVFLIGISTTSDPTGSYYVYEYELAQGNDYPHYGVWGDSYVAAGNFTGAQKVYTFNRAKMLVGDATAEIVGFSPAALAGSGFTAPIPVHSEAAGAATGPIKIVYYQDDAFGLASDHIGLWNVTMDWSTATGTISAKNEIPTTAFDALIAGTGGDPFANLEQPGTSQRLDAIVGAVMNMSHWYKFPLHESILLNWVVEIGDGSQISGIRWVELRSTDNGANWQLYQEGTFTDPTGSESVFMGCISMDKQGNIGLGYTKTGNTTFPSLYYTGRMVNDPLGTMTVAEDLVILGNTVTTNARYGDYGQAVRDPNDDLTFWVTSEYSGAPDKKVRIYSFKLGQEFTNDIAITNISAPLSGSGLTTTETVTVAISNLGTASQSNIPVTLSVDGVTVASETFTGTIAPGDAVAYTFTQTVNVSNVLQTYNLEACANLATDANNANNCFSRSVINEASVDMAITAITSPQTGVALTATENITFTLANLGGEDQSNITFVITLDGGTPINANFPGPVLAGTSISLNLANAANVSALGAHTICVQVNQSGDINTSNDLLCLDFTNLSCTGQATTPDATACSSDGIKRLILGTINVDDGANGCNTEPAGSPVGYVNRTYLSTDLDRASGSNTHILQAQTNWNTQNLSAWIDFNDNGVFEASELLLNQPYTIEDALESFNLVIPTTAALGSHVIRLKSFDSSAAGDATDPCGDIAFGEIHDYTVKIIDSSFGDCPSITTYTADGWDNGVPTATSQAVIASNYNTATNVSFNACSLQVNTGVTLIVAANTFISVKNDITNDGTINVAHTGSIVQEMDAATVTNNGAIDVTVNTPTLNTADFMILGSPMTGETREDVWANAFNVQDYTTSAFVPNTAVGASGVVYNFSCENIDDWNAYTTGALTAGEGFLVFPQMSLTAPGGVFTYNYNTGTLNNGVITRPLGFNTTAANSPNMLSNPYPSGIDAAAFLAANPQIDAAYFWDHLSAPSPTEPGPYVNNYDMDDISVINSMGPVAAANGGVAPTGVIATAQGFGVFASAAGTATFNNSMRVTTGNTTLRTVDENTNRLWLNIRSEAYGVGSNALVGFTSNATAGYEATYDSPRLATIVSLHSNIGTDLENGYIIQGREAFNADMQVPFSFATTVDENTAYRISLSDFDGNAWSTVVIYLVDNTTGAITNLSENDYVFTSQMGTFNGRFTLQFRDKSLGNDTINLLNKITLYPNPASSIVNISSPTQALVSGVFVTDIQGRVVESVTIDNTNNYALDMSKLESAVYFVTIDTNIGSITKRFIKK